jgi:ADP-heptose:LPS heptosyltransferase
MFLSRKLPKSPLKIAVIQLDHIGDMIIAGCFLANIKAAFPQTSITVIGREMCREAASLCTGADEFLPCNAPWLSRNDSMGWPSFLSFCKQHYQQFDMVFDLHGDLRNNILARILGKYCAGYGFRGMGFLLSRQAAWHGVFSRHITEMQLALLDACGIPGNPGVSGISVPPAAFDTVRAKLKQVNVPENGFYLLQTSSGRSIKDWPQSNWNQLSATLSRHLAIITADRNASNVAIIKAASLPEKFFDLRLSLTEYAALVSMCRRIITVDTFAVHLAKALGKPVTAIYSGTNLTTEWGPFMPSGEDRILQDISCPLFPCSIMHDCPYGYPSPCMIKINPESVADTVERT